MKVVILAGGLGTRLSEETEAIPKPMVQIGGKPILWHIMKIYSYYGFNDFIICLGYKGNIIKEYFSHYFLHQSDITLDIKTQRTIIHNSCPDDWRVTLVDTGLDTMTGGRLRKIKNHIYGDTFMLTYGDGVADIHITKLLAYHYKHGKRATVTAIKTTGKFGSLYLDGNTVTKFVEKPSDNRSWVSGGFFVLNKSVIDMIESDGIFFEREPLSMLAKRKQIMAYKHSGFWKCMDTLRDKIELEQCWDNGGAAWKVW